MSRMHKMLLATAMMMAASAQGGNMFAPGLFGGYHEDPYANETPEERKARLHKLYGEDNQLHEFTIKGESIMARNKKSAMKIYANRHPELKKKRKH